MTDLAFMDGVAKVRDVQTQAVALVGYLESEAAEDAAAEMAGQRFDFAPVIRESEIVGRVNLNDLNNSGGRVGDSARPLSARYLISADSPLRELLRWLLVDPWLLVVDRNTISGVVTPSDLNKQAPRAWFYLLVAAFEIRLSDHIRGVMTGEQAVGILSAKQRAQVVRRQKSQQERDFESDLIALMSLTDLLTVGAETESVRNRFGADDGAAWTDRTAPISDFRHEVMHPTRQMLSDRQGLSRLIEIEETLLTLLGVPTGYS